MHSAREQQPLSLAPSRPSPTEHFWFGFGVLWSGVFSAEENSKTETFCRICIGSVNISEEKVSLSMGVQGRWVETKI